MKRDAASQRQVQAADPDLSTWLSANAGSGKTRVLTDRVARLLLNGVYPQHILCLTYTKAAASEMQNRLFRRLGEWAMLDDETLRANLFALGQEKSLDDDGLRKARRLFARAIETPGGLKIQTIHSFCAGLLRRFPLEAGVSPQFVEMDDRAARQLRDDILDAMADGPDQIALDGVVALFTSDDLAGLTQEVTRHRADFPQMPDSAAIWRHFGLHPGFSADDVLAAVFPGHEAALIADLLPFLRAGTSTDIKNADRLAALDLSVPDTETLNVLETVFLTGAKAKEPFSAKIGSFPTKQTRQAAAHLMPDLDALMQRVEDAREARVALAAAQRMLALHRFAAAFLPRYAAAKMRNGWLDFDDLILHARDLLTDPSVAEWVLFRLDGGLDHILVDEAQDTSPVQWQVIDLLTREFSAGAGARADVARTIFVVGDKKQSIYSFQGADPAGFDRMQDRFGTRLENAGKALIRQKLEYSFRSSPAILAAVDHTFHQEARQGVGDDFLHRAFHQEMPGRVDLWPVVEKSDAPASTEWTDPVDMVGQEHHGVRLARRIAGEIQRMIRSETLWTLQGRRPVRAGDVLILVQRRSDLFHEIIRACKTAGLPIAGADRLKIGGELAVKDLTALLSFLALPEDDLSLACALRSPLFGWDEAAVYSLSAGRAEKFLWETLRKRKDAFAETHDRLSALRGDADYLRPYDLIERILTRHDGRRRLIARLGDEAGDGIDALLAQALAYERLEVPSLTGFLSWLASGEVEIRRQPDGAGDRIRVMTVHGAKGLEAPIVILPDTGKRRDPRTDEILKADDGTPMWRTPAGESPAVLSGAREAAIQRQTEERQRLLYVAMTRAEQWLITCAAGDLDKGDSWYERIADGMQRAGAAARDFPFGAGLRLEHGDWNAPPTLARDAGGAGLPDLPAWATERAETPARPAQVASPSDLGGTKVLPGEGAGLAEDAAKLRGTRLHLLLEHLSKAAPDQWPTLARHLLKNAETPPDETEIASILTETEAVLEAPALADLFAADALTEVDVTAALPALGGTRVQGAIDRLIVREDHVLAVDYKSNTVVPDTPDDVPEGLLRQMGAYAAALERIYPGRKIETAILWTRTARMMPLPSALLAEALSRAVAP